MDEPRSYGWTHAGQDGSHDYLLPFVRRHIEQLLGPRKGRIADLGCGNGYVTSLLAEAGHDVVGIDASSDGILHARSAHPALRFEVASIYSPALRETVGEAVDVVVSLEVLEHLFYPRRLFEQAFELLRPTGHLILSTPYHGYWKNLAISAVNGWDRHFNVGWDGGHIKFFSVDTASAMAGEAGFIGIQTGGAGRLPFIWKSMFLIATKP